MLAVLVYFSLSRGLDGKRYAISLFHVWGEENNMSRSMVVNNFSQACLEWRLLMHVDISNWNPNKFKILAMLRTQIHICYSILQFFKNSSQMSYKSCNMKFLQNVEASLDEPSSALQHNRQAADYCICMELSRAINMRHLLKLPVDWKMTCLHQQIIRLWKMSVQKRNFH